MSRLAGIAVVAALVVLGSSLGPNLGATEQSSNQQDLNRDLNREKRDPTPRSLSDSNTDDAPSGELRGMQPSRGERGENDNEGQGLFDSICLCHVPAWNPALARTICVGPIRAYFHLLHGDALGSCPDDDDDDDDDDEDMTPT